MKKRTLKIHESQGNFISEVLTLAAIGLPLDQFKPFKKAVMKAYHNGLKRDTSAILDSRGQVEGECPSMTVNGKEGGAS